MIMQRRVKVDFRYYTFLQEVNFTPVVQKKPSEVKSYSIAFIIPVLPKYSGGITSVLRVGTYLSEFGHTVSYIVLDDTNISQMRKNALCNLSDFKGEILTGSSLSKNYDIGVATSWVSAYYLKKYQNYYGYKVYFIQGFEPGFYPEGEKFYLARNTYKFHFHMISLGHWNKKRIEPLVSTPVDTISFPFEPDDYPLYKRKISIEKTLKMAVYIRIDPYRAPILVLQSLKLLEKELQSRGILLDISFFGLPKSIKLPLGKNLGQLSPKELKTLYDTSHIGVAVSFSNISLVPYEMIASGLPVCDFLDGSGIDFFGSDALILSDALPQSFVEKILYFVENQDALNRLVKKAQTYIQYLSWESSAKEFAEHLNIPVLHSGNGEKNVNKK